MELRADGAQSLGDIDGGADAVVAFLGKADDEREVPGDAMLDHLWAVSKTCSILMSLRMRSSISSEPDSTPTSRRRRPDCAARPQFLRQANTLVGPHRARPGDLQLVFDERSTKAWMRLAASKEGLVLKIDVIETIAFPQLPQPQRHAARIQVPPTYARRRRGPNRTHSGNCTPARR